MNSKLHYTVPVLVVAGMFLIQADFVSSQQADSVSSLSQPRARDPGVRKDPAGAPPSAGGHIAGLTRNEIRFFDLGREDFIEEERVDDGLGPRMNLDNCGECHAQPAIGGTSPAVNPQVAFASKFGGTDFVPPFVLLNGPVREARFVRIPTERSTAGFTPCSPSPAGVARMAVRFGSLNLTRKWGATTWSSGFRPRCSARA